MSGRSMSAERLGKLAMLAVDGRVVFLSLRAAEIVDGGDVEVMLVSLVLRLQLRLGPVAAGHLSRSGLE